MMDDSSDEEAIGAEVTSPQTSFHVATTSVLNTLRNIRTTPQLRQSFVTGCQDAAMSEVQRSFQSKRKGRSSKAKGKRKKKYFKHTIACFSGPDVKFNPTRQEWDTLYSLGLGKAWKGHVEACSYTRKSTGKRFPHPPALNFPSTTVYSISIV